MGGERILGAERGGGRPRREVVCYLVRVAAACVWPGCDPLFRLSESGVFFGLRVCARPPPVLGDSAALLRDCSTFFYLIVDTTTISTTTKLTVFGLLRKTTTGTTQATIVVVGVTLFALPASDYNYQERYCASLQNACVINSAWP